MATHADIVFTRMRSMLQCKGSIDSVITLLAAKRFSYHENTNTFVLTHVGYNVNIDFMVLYLPQQVN